MLKKVVLVSGIFSSLFITQNANANPSLVYPIGKPTLQCVKQAADNYHLPFELLLGLNSVERGATGQYVGNTNGTQDTGAFQINSIHYKRAGRLGVSPTDLASRGCYNAQFAAMLLSEALNNPSKQHLDFYTRAAGYHSWTPKYNAIYRRKLVAYTQQWHNWLLANPQAISGYPTNGYTTQQAVYNPDVYQSQQQIQEVIHRITYNPNNPYSPARVYR